MNMRVLKPSQKRLVPGDIFVYQVGDRPFGYGRVVRTDVPFGPSYKALLIYIYNEFSARKTPIPTLSRNRLLISPILINRLPWSRGYLEVVASHNLSSDDVLRPHCFECKIEDKYFDENGAELPCRIEPCGLYALSSFKTLDVRISLALGIPPHPDTMPPPGPSPEEIARRIRRMEDQNAAAERRSERLRRRAHDEEA